MLPTEGSLVLANYLIPVHVSTQLAYRISNFSDKTLNFLHLVLFHKCTFTIHKHVTEFRGQKIFGFKKKRVGVISITTRYPYVYVHNLFIVS